MNKKKGEKKHVWRAEEEEEKWKESTSWFDFSSHVIFVLLDVFSPLLSFHLYN